MKNRCKKMKAKRYIAPLQHHSAIENILQQISSEWIFTSSSFVPVHWNISTV